MKHVLTWVLSFFMATSLAASPILKPPAELTGKTIEVIIPYAPGGDTDATQRFMAQQLSDLTGLEFVFLNHPGANTIVGAGIAAKSRADGTVLFGHDNSLYVTNPALEVPHHVDPKNFVPAAVFALTPQFFYVSTKHGINDIDDLIHAAKHNPKFNYGCSFTHGCLSMSWFFNAMGIGHVQQVNYKSVPQALQAVDQNDIMVFPGGAGAGISGVTSGLLQPLAVAWKEPLEVFPGAKPLSTAVPGFKAYNIQMVSLPAATPPHIVEFWNRAYREVAKTAETQRRFKELSVVSVDMNVTQTKRFLDQEYQDMKSIRKFYRAQ